LHHKNHRPTHKRVRQIWIGN